MTSFMNCLDPKSRSAWRLGNGCKLIGDWGPPASLACGLESLDLSTEQS